MYFNFICIFILNFRYFAFTFPIQWFDQKTSIQYSIFQIALTPNLPTLFIILNIHWIPIPISSLIDIHCNSQPILSTTKISCHLMSIQLPHPNSSDLNIGWHSFGISHCKVRKKYLILLPTILHDKWQFKNKNCDLLMY